MNFHYNKHLKTKARNLRINSTIAERVIWNDLLRKRNLLGFKFLRQRPIDNFIVDFFCKELLLVIEIDGFTHENEETIAKDMERQKHLEDLGYTVVRFSDFQIHNEFEKVRDSLVCWILENKIG